MAKKDYMRKIFVFQPYECAAVEKYLMKMASEGWMIDSIKGRGSTPCIFVFCRMKPTQLTFSVDYFQQGTIFDEQPYIPTMEYIEYCKQEGWNHVCTKGKMQIFYTELKEPLPIQTDEKLKFKAINNAFLMQNSYIWLVILSISVLFYLINSNFEKLVTRYNWLISTCVYVLMIIIALIILADYIKWRICAKKNLKSTGKLNLKTRRQWITVLHLDALLISVFLIIMYTLSPNKLILLTILLYLGILQTYYYFYEDRNHSTRVNKLIFGGRILINVCVIIMVNVIIFSSNMNQWSIDETKQQLIDPLPINESNEISYIGNRIDSQETFLAQLSTYTYYYEWNKVENSPIIRLKVFESPYKWITSKYIDGRISGKKYDYSFHEGDPVPWGAEKMYKIEGEYRGWKNTIILVYKNRVLVLDSQSEIPYTKENIEKINSILEKESD
ncbi:DUF2812 domain-containing protein [Alkalibaculum sp. M08DMB]|uniref:DUF2812 domain-containing protein n=1 Tax=Alkalibaculum sporogenes TaxID=2655001 RepID=A0A6A7K559_9FIRM|nr:DUF2812 domain-containing protein [Alkalibaculum sporogenes]MPW24515.1 DUF2812 domain-containing protein [Alkalibaculum sporogenes]